ncbi:MAG: hypothetical protein HY694_15790 [Deltaproteobacteria bacterium]|nr:hypothetical protein [Deltaproteobacteria bacterium]
MKEFTLVINRERSEALEEISKGRAEILLVIKGDNVRQYLAEKGIKVISGVLIPRRLSNLEQKISLLPF